MLLLVSVYHSIRKQIRTVPCRELLVSSLSFGCCAFSRSSGLPYLVVTPCSPGLSETLGEFLASAVWTRAKHSWYLINHRKCQSLVQVTLLRSSGSK